MNYKKIVGSIMAGIIFLLCIQFTHAQVKTKLFRDNIPQELLPLNNAINNVIDLTAPTEFAALMNKNSKVINDNRFASSLSVNIDFILNATIFTNEEFRIYTLKLNAKDAFNISLEFDNFILSDNAVLSIYTDKELTDSITSTQNNPANIWATRVYQGSYLNIVLKERLKQKEGSKIRISKVNFGYKDYGMEFGNPGASAPCNVNIACAAGNGWTEERNSIALIVANGRTWCTGSLIMNTCNTNIPYLLTANHCLDGNSNNWVFQFQYWSNTCIDNNGMNEDVQFNGCQIRANNAATDFALLQLNQTPATNSGIRYAGWSRLTPANGSLITNTTILHHPKGDVMKISVDNNSPTQMNIGGLQCWQLDLDLGATEGGSSGAPYFNQNHRIIGQHFGITTNLPPCDNPPKIGGRFDLSWTGGATNATRLSNWLDPINSGATTTNTTNIASLYSPITGADITGADNFCTGSSQYTLNIVPAGTSISWVSSNTNVGTITPTGTTATVTMVSEGTITLTATITHCATTVVRTKTITLGFPYFSTQIYGPDTAAPYGQYTYAMNLPYSYPPAYYNWRVPSGWSILFGQGTSILYVQTGGMGTGGAVEVDVTACGFTRLTHIYTEIGDGGWIPDLVSPPDDKEKYKLKVMPNPVHDNVTFSLVAADNKTTDNSYSIQQVTIADKMGSIKKRLRFSIGQLTQTINISGLPADIYVVSVYDGHTWQKAKLIVQ